ncbi:23S rRNA (guanosine2251-2'-O)-methyltransferase [Thermosyntropha lipolytica DSM 11003]|uniref:23S rRNA (Guanosine2251-2'-O)-methyltransferase n=1 Tax=Thermosyntropha lipolytica DSM 11003 TaxID=1123382 RepID=A0A1M5NQZ9_9FIRM|nr:23S rRNA (guanosine(2251)-2'-O)-methyltransferase RlmB [Thermosyntropha lipolytica]SHG91908.1 23S rRNA (guanosine2251-2'-O)-methyltransferase [Thermosyntropha lipolytica DSM 11003]
MKETVAGINGVTEMLKAKRRKIYRIFIQEGKKGSKVDELVKLATGCQIPVQRMDKKDMDRMYPAKNHQGVVAEVEPYKYSSLEEVLEYARGKGEEPFLVLLDGIEDPQNMGAIVRTALCAGVHGVVIPKHHAVEVTDAVVRASAGAVEYMHIIKTTNLVGFIKELKACGFWIIGADAEGKEDYFALSFPSPVAVVVGSEGDGMRRLVKENCDFLVKIPMQGEINSLNASVAAALIIYEVVRQRWTKKDELVNGEK